MIIWISGNMYPFHFFIKDFSQLINVLFFQGTDKQAW